LNLELLTGRGITLLELTQWFTYAGSAKAISTRAKNRQYLEGLAQDKTFSRTGRQPFLIEPEETLIDSPANGPAHPFGLLARLPGVTCIARFGSYGTAGETGVVSRSELTVIWLQESYAFPIDPSVAAQLREIDWERLTATAVA
jgi:hypothetical protein